MKNTLKNMLWVGLGVGGTIAFNKYCKPAMQKMDKMIDNTVKAVSDN